jgi:hypothetical protein
MKRAVKLVARVPEEIKQWLLDQAALNAATLGSVISQACRAQMERQQVAAAKDSNAAAGE